MVKPLIWGKPLTFYQSANFQTGPMDIYYAMIIIKIFINNTIYLTKASYKYIGCDINL